MEQQIATGWRRVLSQPCVYESFQRAIGARSLRKTLAQQYLRPNHGERVLDVGCGPAYLLEFLPDVHYVGVDLSPAYIEHANRTFRGRGKFLVADATNLEAHDLEPFHLVTAVGFLHHLSDEGVVQLLGCLGACMSGPTGRLVTIVGCYIAGQSRIAAFLLSLDCGRHVRTPRGLRIVSQACV